jgi:hypothetical protein
MTVCSARVRRRCSSPGSRARSGPTRSLRQLPADLAAAIGLPASCSLGRAATELLLAVDDHAGPRCRSFRAAAYYLAGRRMLDGALVELDVLTADRPDR